jgi:regulator of cell morphogenesis and NO signaling
MSTLETELVGTLCTRHPLAVRVLHRHGIGGVDPARSLHTACTERGLDPEALLRELTHEEDQLTGPWRTHPLDELLDHIVRTYHRPFDAELSSAAASITAARPPAGDPRHAIWDELGRQLGELRADMEQHMEKEERVLFPWLRGRAATAGAPIRAMLLEHADTIQLLHTIHDAAKRWIAAGPPSPASDALVDELARVEGWLCEHIHLESNELFPRALETEPPRR